MPPGSRMLDGAASCGSGFGVSSVNLTMPSLFDGQSHVGSAGTVIDGRLPAQLT